MNITIPVSLVIQTLGFIANYGSLYLEQDKSRIMPPPSDLAEVEPGVPDEFRAYWLEGQRVFNTVNAMFQSESMKWRLQKFKAKTPGLKFYYFNSKQYRRRIFMTEALFPISPLGLSNVFWEEGKDMPEWNPNVLKAGNLMDIGTKARATYQISKGAGAISSREFLNVNFKDKVANGTGFLVAYASIPSFPGYTPSKDYVTGINGPSGFEMTPIADGEGTRMRWIFNSDLKFSGIPNGVIYKLLPMTHNGFVEYLYKHTAKKTGKIIVYTEQGEPQVVAPQADEEDAETT